MSRPRARSEVHDALEGDDGTECERRVSWF